MMLMLTSVSILPRGLGLLSLDFLLYLRLLVDVVEVVHDDRDGKWNTENSTDCTNLRCYKIHIFLIFSSDSAACLSSSTIKTQLLINCHHIIKHNVEASRGPLDPIFKLGFGCFNQWSAIIKIKIKMKELKKLPRRWAFRTRWLGRCRRSPRKSSWLSPSRETGQVDDSDGHVDDDDGHWGHNDDDSCDGNDVGNWW